MKYLSDQINYVMSTFSWLSLIIISVAFVFSFAIRPVTINSFFQLCAAISLVFLFVFFVSYSISRVPIGPEPFFMTVCIFAVVGTPLFLFYPLSDIYSLTIGGYIFSVAAVAIIATLATVIASRMVVYLFSFIQGLFG